MAPSPRQALCGRPLSLLTFALLLLAAASEPEGASARALNEAEHGASGGEEEHGTGEEPGHTPSEEHGTGEEPGHTPGEEHGTGEEPGHTQAEEHGHGGEKGLEGHEEEGEYDRSATLLLYGGLAFFMALFYLTHINKRLTQLTYQVISQVASIFMAVLWFSFWEHCIAKVEASMEAHEDWELFVAAVMGLFMLLFTLVLATLTLWFLDSRWLLSKAMLSILCHVTGFGALNFISHVQDWFADLVPDHKFWSALVGELVGILISFIVLRLWISLMHRCVIDDLESDDESAFEKTEEALDEFMADAITLAASYCTLRTLAVLISSGSLPNLLHTSGVHDPTARLFMLGAAVLFQAAALVCVLIQDWVRFKNDMALSRNALVLRAFVNHLAAWAWVTVGRWVVYETWFRGNQVLGHIIFSMIASFSCMGVMVLIGHFVVVNVGFLNNGEGLKNMIIVGGLTVGLAWELTFEISVEGIKDNSREAWLIWFLPFIMTAVMLPAYLFLMYPKAAAYDDTRFSDEQAMIEYNDELKEEMGDLWVEDSSPE